MEPGGYKAVSAYGINRGRGVRSGAAVETARFVQPPPLQKPRTCADSALSGLGVPGGFLRLFLSASAPPHQGSIRKPIPQFPERESYATGGSK